MIDEYEMTEEDVRIEAALYLSERHRILYEHFKNAVASTVTEKEVQTVGEMFDVESKKIRNQLNLIEHRPMTCQTYTIGKVNFQLMQFTSDDHPDSETPSK